MRRREVTVAILAVIVMTVFTFAVVYKLDGGDLIGNIITGFAVFTQDDEAGFDEGSYSNTEWNGSDVALISGQTSGTYTSKVFDAGADAIWNSVVESSITPSVNFLYGVDGGGDVYKTVDFATWTQTVEGYGGGSGTQGMFSDTEYLYILAGDAKKVWRSEDFGITWEDVNDAIGKELKEGESDLNYKLYVIAGDGTVYQSVDYGVTWNEKGDFNAGGGSNAKGICVDSNNVIYVADVPKDVYSSSDEGVTWVQKVDDYGGGEPDDIVCVGTDLYILRDKEVWKSTDSGVTWTEINHAALNDNGLRMTSDSSGNLYALDVKGRSYKSTDSGVTWIQLGDMNPGDNDPKGLTDFAESSILSFQIRNCSASDCSDGSWETVSDLSSIGNVSRYFQYKVSFASPDSSVSPALESVIVDYTEPESDSPSISYGGSTTEEGTYSNVNSINVDVDLSDESQIYSFINFDNSLVGFWKMNESSGNIIDYSGLGNDGVNNGASGGASGKFGGALSFDGVDDYINFTNGVSQISGSTTVTISAWIKTNDKTHKKDVVLLRDLGDDLGHRFYLQTMETGVFSAQTTGGGSNVLGTTQIILEEWYHVVAVLNGQNLKIYVNGNLDGETASLIPITNITADRLTIGAGEGYDESRVFNGTLDEVLIFSRVLSTSEISALYGASSYSVNFTDLDYDTYEFYSYAQDVYGNEAQTSMRTVTLSENAPPVLNLINPQDGDAYGYNESLSLNFSVSDADDNLDSCWYTLDFGFTNTTIVNCANTIFDVAEGSSVLVIYANDSQGEGVSDSASFSVAVGAPTISLSSPVGSYLSSGDVTFTYTPTDIDLDSCSLWGNFSGVFEINQTDLSPTSGVENTFSLTLEDGGYLWNVECNDSAGNSAVNGNQSFWVDTAYPVVSITQPTGTKTSRTGIALEYSVSDLTPTTCWYNIYQGASVAVVNTTISNCADTTFSISADADFVLNLYVNDSAGNEDSASSSFSVDTSVSPPPNGGDGGGGGGGGSLGVTAEKKLNIEIGDELGEIIVYPGDERRLEVSIKNKAATFLNKCKLTGDCESDDLKNIAPGEIVEFAFTLQVPESGDFNPKVKLECVEGEGEISLNILLINSEFNIEIKEMKLEGSNLIVNYILDSDRAVELEFAILNSVGGKIIKKTESVASGENSVELDVSDAEKGMLKLAVYKSGGKNPLVEESFIFSGSSITGFAFRDVLNSSIGIGVILLVFVVICFFVVKSIFYLRKKHRR